MPEKINSKDIPENYIEHCIQKNSHKISQGGQLMFMTCIGAFTVGCNWGFIKKSTETFKDKLALLKQEQKNILFYKVLNGVLIECNTKYLMHVLNILFDGKSPIAYQELAQRRSNEPKELERWLKKIIKDGTKLPYITQSKDGMIIDMALYAVNTSHIIRINQIDYPAYRVNMNEFISMLYQYPELQNTQLITKTDEGRIVYVPITQLYNNKQLQLQAYKAAQISEANTGLLIKLLVPRV